MPSLSLPHVPHDAFSRDFIIDNNRVEITSVDVAPHGGFFVAGCSNGVILMFDMSDNSSQKNGILLAQIRPKGMHTTLRLTVKISDDSAICFAGVIKGSSEMIAVDMSSFQLNWNNYAPPSSRGRKPWQVQEHVDKFYSSTYEVYSYSDAKLRGFGAATSLPMTESSISEAGTTRRYLLACGMGIKNVHIWQLTLLEPANPFDENQLPVKRDEWKCIYDVACNGMTITHLGFRNEGKELLTKSAGVNIRVWDLSHYTEDPISKPMYEDISNSHDVKCLMENSSFTYGGLYEFAVVKVDKNTPKEANRNVFELPVSTSNAIDEDAGLRRRRTMREVQDIMGTQDGVHVMVLCTDGGIMHYKRPHSYPEHIKTSDNDSDEDSNTSSNHNQEEDLGKIMEVPYPRKEMDMDQMWSLRRVGAQGLVILVHAYFRADKDTQSTNNTNQNNGNIPPPMANVIMQKNGVVVVSVKVLADLLPRDRDFGNMETSSSSSSSSLSTKWHASGLFYQRHSASTMLSKLSSGSHSDEEEEAEVAADEAEEQEKQPSTPRTTGSKQLALQTPSPAAALNNSEQPKAPQAERNNGSGLSTATTGIAMMFGSDSPTSSVGVSSDHNGAAAAASVTSSTMFIEKIGLPPAAPGSNNNMKKRKLNSSDSSSASVVSSSSSMNVAGLATPTTTINARKSTPKLSPVEENNKGGSVTTSSNGLENDIIKSSSSNKDTPVRQTHRTIIPNTRYDSSSIVTPGSSAANATNGANGVVAAAVNKQSRVPMTMQYDPQPLVISPPLKVRRIVPSNRILSPSVAAVATTDDANMATELKAKEDQVRAAWLLAPFTLLWDSFQHALAHYPFPTTTVTSINEGVQMKHLLNKHVLEQNQMKMQYFDRVKHYYDTVIVPQLKTICLRSSPSYKILFAKACFHKIRKEYQNQIVPLILARQQSEWQAVRAKEYVQQSLSASGCTLSSQTTNDDDNNTTDEEEEEEGTQDKSLMKKGKGKGKVGYAEYSSNNTTVVKFMYEDIFLLTEQLEGRLYEQVIASTTAAAITPSTSTSLLAAII